MREGKLPNWLDVPRRNQTQNQKSKGLWLRFSVRRHHTETEEEPRKFMRIYVLPHRCRRQCYTVADRCIYENPARHTFSAAKKTYFFRKRITRIRTVLELSTRWRLQGGVTSVQSSSAEEVLMRPEAQWPPCESGTLCSLKRKQEEESARICDAHYSGRRSPPPALGCGCRGNFRPHTFVSPDPVPES